MQFGALRTQVGCRQSRSKTPKCALIADLKRVCTLPVLPSFSLLSPANALSQLSRLEKQVYSLDNLPFRFPIYKKDIRRVSVDNYLVFYSVDENAKIVYILRVMYGKRDVENIIE